MKQITRTGQFSFRVWRKPEETHSKLLVWPSYFHPLNYHQVWSLYPNGRSKRFEEFCSFNKQWTGSGHKTDSKQNPSNPLLHVQEFLSLIGFMQCTGYSFISTTFWMRVIKCVLYTFVPNIIKLLLLLYIELTISFLIGQKCTVNFWNQRLWRHLAADYTLIMSRTPKVTGNHVMHDRGAWFLTFNEENCWTSKQDHFYPSIIYFQTVWLY